MNLKITPEEQIEHLQQEVHYLSELIQTLNRQVNIAMSGLEAIGTPLADQTLEAMEEQ